jgi:hypothetical protein
LLTRRATLRMRSVEPIEVPPYLWTINAMSVREKRGNSMQPEILSAAVPPAG